MRSITIAGVAALLILFVAPTQGATISLSEVVSDGATPPPAEDLLAAFVFTLDSDDLDAGTVTLSLIVDNMTDENPSQIPYRVNQIFFNMPDTVSSATLVRIDGVDPAPADDWDLLWDEHVNGWGSFDIGLIGGVGVDPNQIYSGFSKTFEIELTGTGLIQGPGGIPGEYFFTTELSEATPPDVPMIVSAKFVDGTSLSGFGATDSPVIPEPATLALLVLGGLVVARRRR